MNGTLHIPRRKIVPHRVRAHAIVRARISKPLQGAEWPPEAPDSEMYAGFGYDLDYWSKENFAEYLRRMKKEYGMERAWRYFSNDMSRVWFWNGDVKDACLSSCSFCKRFYKEFKREWPMADFVENIACNVAGSAETITEIPEVAFDTVKYATPLLVGIAAYVGGKAINLW